LENIFVRFPETKESLARIKFCYDYTLLISSNDDEYLLPTAVAL